MKINCFKISLALILLTGCAYYNTMFNALNSYDSGTDKLEKSKDGVITSDIKNDYQNAIDKCWKIINSYGDSSAYADDALILIAKAHFQVQEYLKSERFLKQFIAKYPESEYVKEAKLWLAKSLIKNEKDDEALEYLKEIKDSYPHDIMNYFALFYLGELYQKKENYPEAIEYLKQCTDLSDDEQLAAEAQYKIGEIYFKNEEFIPAIESFNRVQNFESSLKLEYDSQICKVDAQIRLKEYDSAIKSLQSLLRDERFADKFSLMESKIGKCYLLQNNIENAEKQYYWVLEKYPKTEGSAFASHELAKLLEFTHVNIDSAQSMYSRTSREFSSYEFTSEALVRSVLLLNYLKLKQNIAKDLDDLYLLKKEADIDSLEFTEIVIDSMSVVNADTVEKIVSSADTSKTEEIKLQNSPPVKQKIKMRSEDDIKKSLVKNKFSLAEYFLLTLQNYDSAAVAYFDFIQTAEDSILKPKAYYTLYFLYNYKLQDSLKSERMKNTILQNYPSTVYADYIHEKEGTKIFEPDKETDIYMDFYREAEDLLYKDKYSDAIILYNRIAQEDSGSAWAAKSRFAIAWIYEHKLKDISNAIDAYAAVIKEYPKSEGAKIAKNKIKDPPKIEEVPETKETESPSEIDEVTKRKAKNKREFLEKERESNKNEDEKSPSRFLQDKLLEKNTIDSTEQKLNDEKEESNISPLKSDQQEEEKK